MARRAICRVASKSIRASLPQHVGVAWHSNRACTASASREGPRTMANGTEGLACLFRILSFSKNKSHYIVDGA